jgi:hypothetical protein
MSIGALAAQTTDIWDALKKWAVAEAAERAGIHLDPDDPFSDSSISGAVSQRTGIPLRTMLDQQMIEEDIDDYTARRVSERIGYRISTFRNLQQLRADFELAALAIVTEKTGIPFAPLDGQPVSVDYIKSNVEDWARAALMEKISADAGQALSLLSGAGVDFEAVAESMNRKLEALGSPNLASARGLALEVAEGLVSSSMQRFHAVAVGASKKERRALQLRAAQRKFRATHGNRQKYIPLGMSATIG